MRLLLDTHVWVWSLTEPERLSAPARAALSDQQNELWLSPISAWEVLLLAERGRLALSPSAPEWIAEALRRAPLREAPLGLQVALLSRQVQVAHEDPADRFLAATAQVYELTLVTADARLLAAKGLPAIPA